MLRRIRETIPEAEVPIAGVEGDRATPTHEEQYAALGIWERVRLWFARVFNAASREEILDTWSLRGIGVELQKRSEGAVDAKRRTCGERCAQEITDLDQSARRIETLFNPVREDRAGVIIAVADRYFPEIHRQLIADIRDEVDRSDVSVTERRLRQNLNSLLDRMVSSIDAATRRDVDRAARFADRFARLSSFGFGSMLESFEGSVAEQNRYCAIQYIARSFERLATLCVGMNEPVDLRIAETLALYDAAHRQIEDDEGFKERVGELMRDFASFESTLRSFIHRYQPRDFVRLAYEDPHWNASAPEPVGDWVTVYRSVFQNRIQEVATHAVLRRQARDLVRSVKTVCGQIRPLEGLPDGTRGPISAYWYSALAVKSFFSGLLVPAMAPLKILLINGEFYKTSNRAQYNDAYEQLATMIDRIEHLEALLRPDQSWGEILWVGRDVERQNEISRRVDEDVKSVVATIQTTLDVITNVLGGVLYAQAGSSYDTIANFGQISGRRNAEYVDELKEVHHQFGDVRSVLAEAETVQTRAIDAELALPAPGEFLET